MVDGTLTTSNILQQLTGQVIDYTQNHNNGNTSETAKLLYTSDLSC